MPTPQLKQLYVTKSATNFLLFLLSHRQFSYHTALLEAARWDRIRTLEKIYTDVWSRPDAQSIWSNLLVSCFIASPCAAAVAACFASLVPPPHRHTHPHSNGSLLQLAPMPVCKERVDGLNVLMMAAAAGSLNALRWLLQHGADPNQRTRVTQDAALHMALNHKLWVISFNEKDVIERLNLRCTTLLPQIVDALLQHGASACQLNK